MNKNVEEILKSYNGDDTDLSFYIYEAIKNMQRPERGLEFFARNIGTIQTDKSYILEKRFSDQELHQLDSLYSDYINESLKTLVKMAHMSGWDETMFYKQLWNTIMSDALFKGDGARAFAIFKIAQSELIPYYVLDYPLSMDESRFSELVMKNESTISKIRHILAIGFEQKTEMTSLILNEIQNNNSFEEQCVILAIALDELAKTKVNGILQMMGNPIDQSETKS